MRKRETFHDDQEIARLMRMVSEHVEAVVVVLIVRKADGTLAVVAPTNQRNISEPVAKFLEGLTPDERA